MVNHRTTYPKPQYTMQSAQRRDAIRVEAVYRILQEVVSNAIGSEIYAAIDLSRGRLRSIKAKRAMRALELYADNTGEYSWGQAKAQAEREIAPGYRGHESE